MPRVKQLRVLPRHTTLSVSSVEIALRRAQEDLCELEVEFQATCAKVYVWCEKNGPFVSVHVPADMWVAM